MNLKKFELNCAIDAREVDHLKTLEGSALEGAVKENFVRELVPQILKHFTMFDMRLEDFNRTYRFRYRIWITQDPETDKYTLGPPSGTIAPPPIRPTWATGTSYNETDAIAEMRKSRI